MCLKYEMHNRKGLHCKNCSNEDEMTMEIWRNSDDDKMLKLWWKVEMMMKIWRNCDDRDDDDDGDDDDNDDDDDENMKCMMEKICRAGDAQCSKREESRKTDSSKTFLKSILPPILIIWVNFPRTGKMVKMWHFFYF